MSTVPTREGQDKARVFETLFSSPGMSEKCKINLQLSRQHILLLSRLIEVGLLAEKRGLGDELLGVLPKESLADFRALHEELLGKGNLTDFYQRLKAL